MASGIIFHKMLLHTVYYCALCIPQSIEIKRYDEKEKYLFTKYHSTIGSQSSKEMPGSAD